MSVGLDELCDETWVALRGNLFRRAILGKQRCSEIVMLTIANFPSRELRGCQKDSIHDRNTRKELAATVERKYRNSHAQQPRDTYGMVFVTIVLTWAVEAIVQYIIAQWWRKHFDVEAIRKRYGWER